MKTVAIVNNSSKKFSLQINLKIQFLYLGKNASILKNKDIRFNQ